MNIKKINELAWDERVREKWSFTIPVSKTEIDKARNNEVNLNLTTVKFAPKEWLFDSFKGKKVLCLASGGGQQAPLLAAAGADVISFDISKEQLNKDIETANIYSLNIKTIQGDMCNLSVFSDNTFDMVFNPVSVTYIEDTKPFFKEVSRVLKQNGKFLFGAPNPLIYLFSEEFEEQGILQVTNKLPYYGKDHLSKDEIKGSVAIENSHTLESLIGGITNNKMIIKGFYEDKYDYLIDKYTSTYIAIYAIKI